MQNPAVPADNDSSHILELILNGMDSNLYVSDIETDEILFINEKMKKTFGITENALGKKCWEIFQNGFSQRCGFCPVKELLQDMDTPVVWEELNTVTKRHYRNTDTIIQWTDGKKVHLQDSVDIHDLKLAEAGLRRRLEQQKDMSDIAQHFHRGGDSKALVKDALTSALSITGADLAVIAEDMPDTQSFLYKFCQSRDGDSAQADADLREGDRIFYGDHRQAYDALLKGESITGAEAELGWTGRGAMRHLLIPLYAQDTFWGILRLSSLDLSGDWGESDLHMAKLLGSMLSVGIMRKKAEGNRFAIEQRLHLVMDNVPIAIYWKDKDCVLQGGNSYFAEIMGRPLEDMIGKTDADLLEAAFAKRNEAHDKVVLETGDVSKLECLFPISGREIWIRTIKAPLRDEMGSLTGIVGIFEDITEKKQTDHQLKLMSTIVNNFPQYIINTDQEGHFEFFNPATVEISGYSREELLAGGVNLLLGEANMKLFREQYEPELIETGQILFEMPLTRKNGEICHMAFSTFLVEREGLSSYASIATDITARKQMEADLIKEKEAAEQATSAKSDFLSRMSHEIRTPMNAIIGMTNIARAASDAEKKEYCLEKIADASKHLLGILNDILDMSKIESAKFELSNAEFDLEKMLLDALNIVNFQINEKKQRLQVEIDPNLPTYIIGDELRLRQVITNLLSNAVKFTEKNGTITLRAKRIGGTENISELLFQVADTGIGVTNEQKARIWNAFEQAEGSSNRKYGGTGLGLAISKWIVNLMEGEIWLDSEVNVGSTFSFTIKVENSESSALKTLSAHIDRENLRVLVVDDAQETRDYCAMVLKRFGISTCDVAEDGFAALSKITAKRGTGEQYNLIFVDWNMPVMNGIELTRKIRELILENPIVIMISVSEWSEIEKEARAAGVNKFVSKPLLPSTLMNVINEIKGIPVKPERPARKAADYHFDGCTILLAEDVEINREILYTLLEDTGVRLDYADTGAKALSMFAQNAEKYDAILMDIHMPEMNGYEATEAIRAMDTPLARGIPIIAMTASAFSEDIEKCMKAGMNAHIPKPVEMDALLQTLSEYLRPKKAEASGAESAPTDGPKADDYSGYLPYVDVESGLKRVLNKKKLYWTLLKSCKARDITATLTAAIDTGDWEGGAQSAHHLKGVAANLSLNELLRVSAEMEQAMQKGALPAPAALRDFRETVDATLDAIDHLLAAEKGI